MSAIEGNVVTCK